MCHAMTLALSGTFRRPVVGRAARFFLTNGGAQAARTDRLSPPGGMASPRLELPLQVVKDVIASSSFHIAVETVLLAAILFLLLQRSFRPQKKPLTEEEIDALCTEWQPEPLVPRLTEAQQPQTEHIIAGPTGPRVKLQSGVEALNLVSFNFLGLAGHPDVKSACAAAIRKYGVGSCGPRGFYGTIDVHLELEDALRRYCGAEDCIIYSYDVVTPASAVPAFAKRGDLLVVDDGCCYSLQLGVTLSRSEVRFFKHNDMGDLRRVLEEVKAEDRAANTRTPLNRRFIIVEGLFTNHGDCAPLAQLVALKKEFHFRLWVDESVAFGSLPGPTGRGALETAGVPPSDVDVVTSSMGNSLGSCGGFCYGSSQVINHQRLNASGYCFSASLPPYLAAGALVALRLLGEQPELREKLGRNAAVLRAGLESVPGIQVPAGEAHCPIIHLRLADTGLPAGEQEPVLQRVCDRCLAKHRVLLTTAKYASVDRLKPAPSIRIVVSAAHSEADMAAAVKALTASIAAEVQ